MKFGAVLLVLISSTSALGGEIPFAKSDEFPAQAYDVIAEKRVVWLGETHGTKEAPELLLGLVKLISKHDVAAPLVALEIPASQQAAFAGYMASGDDSLLRKSAFFKREFRDGRSSQALVRVLSDLRRERIAAVICFDSAQFESAQQRDTEMAENLHVAAQKYPAAKLVVLSGSVHSCILEGTSWDATYRPAAFELIRKIRSVVTFTIAFESGTAWVLTSQGFGEQKMIGQGWKGTAPHFIATYPEPVQGHHGIIFTRTLTGSPPW